jgi:UDP-N-acetylglucosamine 1-carboxyvinyltransferase
MEKKPAANERFVIEGGHSLQGEVRPAGNKNAALPILAAALLTDERVVLHNVPDIEDVQAMFYLLDDLGVQIERLGEHDWALTARDVRKAALDPEICKQIRASILLAGPLLARCGHVELPPPGGDVIGRRRVDTHFLALHALGAQIDANHRRYTLSTPTRLRGSDIFLDEASVTATENAILAAATAAGTTLLCNAASEPHVQDLCHLLNTLGARIEGIGSNQLRIEGVERLHGGEFTVGPDHIEVGSLIGMAVVTGSELLIRNAAPQHLRMTQLTFGRLGITWEARGDDIFVPAEQELRVVDDVGGSIPKIDDGPWPAFPADMVSIAVILATQSHGTVLIHEKMYESRLYFVDKLISMGARIVLCDPHRAVISGPARLHGEEMQSPDIRAGMALVIAALCAEGTSMIRNIRQIDRGYEKLEERLRSLGAHIVRESC